jgi:predicted anti-sigma-YlaC factor YlaD
MSCAKLRNHLTLSAGEPLPEPLQRHLRECAPCRRYAERVDAARSILRGHRVEVEPDPGFAIRVAARLREQPAEMLGWAAQRLLPATLALLLVLAWFAFSAPPDTTYADEELAPTEDLFTWVLEPSGEEQ